MAWTRAADIGERLREVRQKMGLTQAAFGELMDVTDQSVSDYEGGRSRPQRSTLEKLAKSLGMDVEVFAEGSKLPTTLPRRPAGPRSEVEWWLNPAEIRKRQAALLELLAKFRQETAAYRAAGLVPSAEKVLEWLERMETLAAIPPDQGSAPAGGSRPPTADPAPR